KYPEEVSLITETPKYLGTWINDKVKVLRWNHGEIHIREKESVMKVVGYKEMKLGVRPLYELNVVNGELLKSILISTHTIIGYDAVKRPLWQTNSFTKLAEIIG